MFARIENGVVVEIVPAVTALIEGDDGQMAEQPLFHPSLLFAPADDTVTVGMLYESESGVFASAPVLDEDRAIRAEILELEAGQTPRRIREAVLGTDGGWLAALEEQIAGLRSQLS